MRNIDVRLSDGSLVHTFTSKENSILIHGKTGMGKTNFLSNIILGIIRDNEAEDVHLFVIDLKGIDYKSLKGVDGIDVVNEDNVHLRLRQAVKLPIQEEPVYVYIIDEYSLLSENAKNDVAEMIKLGHYVVFTSQSTADLFPEVSTTIQLFRKEGVLCWGKGDSTSSPIPLCTPTVLFDKVMEKRGNSNG